MTNQFQEYQRHLLQRQSWFWTFCYRSLATLRNDGIQIWRSRRSVMASTRFYSFIQRTGWEMRDSLLPIRDKICGACHEIIWISCSDASMCDFSEWNKYCCHTDNAAVYPLLEWMLYLLLVGNIISASVFIEYTAWMRALSKKLYGLDRLASTRNRDTHNYQSRYRDLFETILMLRVCCQQKRLYQ